MPTFNTFVKQVETNSAGSIRITVLKQTNFDDGTVHDHPHQITIDTLATDDEISAYIELVNADLNRMGYPSIDPRELDWPLKIRAFAHQQPVVKERRTVEKKNREDAAAKAEADRVENEKAEVKAAEKRAAEAQALIDDAVAKALKAQADKSAADHATTAALVAKGH